MDKKIVESRRDVGQAILIIVMAVIFFGLLGTFITFYIAPQYELTKRIFLTLLGLGVYLFSILSLRHYLKEVPKIIISTTRVTIKSLFSNLDIPLSDIQEVGLRQKSPLLFVFMSVPMESTIIKSKKHGEVIIWDQYYENINRLKFTIEKIANKVKNGDLDFDELTISKPKPKVTLDKLNPNDIRLEQFKEYKGNIFLNFNSLVFFGFLIFTLIKFDLDKIGVFLFVNGIFYGLMGYQSNYFLMSDNYLQVKNYLWFWKKTTYRLTDINEVILEIPGKLSESARIVLKNYSTSLNPAGSLKNRHWIEFMDDLEKKGIKVRDELYLRD
jgi:hypothetical protein